jgi:hypothetical protein
MGIYITESKFNEISDQIKSLKENLSYNNANDLLVKEYNFKIKILQSILDDSIILDDITRIEVINHTDTRMGIGRQLVHYGKNELSFQDNGKTLKIFI